MPVLVVVFLMALLVGVPVFVALAGSSLIYTHFIAGIPDFIILHRMAGGLDSFPLLAVPFFILAGNLMNSAGITNRIYDFAVATCGWMRGGLAHVNIFGSVIFAGMSGTAIADAAGLGTIEIKAMQDHGYDTEFSVGVTAASATLGPIIPPSLPFGDPAVADSAVDVAARDYANTGIDAVAAAHHGNVEVALAYFFSIGVTSAAVGIDGAAPIRCTQIDAAELA